MSEPAECHDAETLPMAKAVILQSQALVQVALNEFWDCYGQPSELCLNQLRAHLTECTGEALKEFFGFPDDAR